MDIENSTDQDHIDVALLADRMINKILTIMKPTTHIPKIGNGQVQLQWVKQKCVSHCPKMLWVGSIYIQ